MADMVNHPPHYKGEFFECIEITRHLPHNLANAFKYMYRFRSKGNPQQDLDKAIWYLEDFINNVCPTKMGELQIQALGVSAKYIAASGLLHKLDQYTEDLQRKGLEEYSFFEKFAETLDIATNEQLINYWSIAHWIRSIKDSLETITVG